MVYTVISFLPDHLMSSLCCGGGGGDGVTQTNTMTDTNTKAKATKALKDDHKHDVKTKTEHVYGPSQNPPSRSYVKFKPINSIEVKFALEHGGACLEHKQKIVYFHNITLQILCVRNIWTPEQLKTLKTVLVDPLPVGIPTKFVSSLRTDENGWLYRDSGVVIRIR